MRAKLEPTCAVLVPVLVCSLVYVVLVTTGLDDTLTDPCFDPATKTWIYKKVWWANDVLHKGGRDFVFVTGLAGLGVALFGGRWERTRPWRRSGLFVALAIGLSAAIAGWLKHRSPVPGPWDATRYGGAIPHLSPFADYPPGLELGGCFPGAHAAGAFAFMAFYYVLRERDVRRAWVALGGGFALGFAYGAVQVLRGAHFPSHNAASGVLVAVLLAALYWGAFGGRLRARAPSEHSSSVEKSGGPRP